MKRIQYIGTTTLSSDTVIGKTWAPGEALFIDSDTVASAVVASSTSFKDISATSLILSNPVSASRSLTVADSGKIVPVSATGVTFTIPVDTAIDCVDFKLTVAGTVTVTGATGVTVNGSAAGSASTSSTGATFSLVRTAANTYTVAEVGVNKASDALVDAGTDDATYMTPAKTTRALGKRKADPLVSTVTDLRALADSSVTRVYLSGNSSSYDGGEGMFYVKSGDTTSTDNGGTVIVDALNRRWFRYEQLTITPQMFGGIPDEISGGSFDNKPALDAAFSWALAQQTGVTVDLQGYTWSCSAAPVIGKPSTAATPNQAQPITIRGSSAQRMLGKKGARIKLMATKIGEHQAILRVEGTQAVAWYTFENISLECPTISASIAAQTPSNNSIIIPGGEAKGYVTGTPVWFTGGGGASEITKSNSSFYYLIKLAGTDVYQLALNPVLAAAGTAISLTSAWTGTTTVTATSGSAIHGLLFDGTRFSAPRIYGVRVINADNSFTIQAVDDTANGEFAHFEKCEGIRCKRFFYMPATAATGQALETTFIECSGNPRFADGEACFEYGGGIRGYGVTSFSFNCSVLEVSANGNDGGWRKDIYFIIDNGTSGSNTFIGGRVENVTGIMQTKGSSWEEHTTIEGMTFAGLASTDTNPTIYINSGAIPTVGGTLVIRGCHLYRPPTVWAAANSVVNVKALLSSAHSIYFKNTAFSFNKIAPLGSGSSSTIDFQDCTQKITTGANATIATRKFSQRISGQVPFSLPDRSGVASSSCYPGVPSNLLAYPNFGNSFGATITAPSPWVHTGAATFNRCDAMTEVTTPSARKLRFEPSSGIKQVINETPTAGVPLYYQANAGVSFMSTYSDRIRIALENDTTGEVYDEVFLSTSASTLKIVNQGLITLTAIPMVTATGQQYRLVIQNLGTVNVNHLTMYWQLLSKNQYAAYVTPRTDGSAEADYTSLWDANIDTLRAIGRVALPYKTDTYGKSSNLRDIYSDVYVSQTTERMVYASGSSQTAGQKWWEVPRVQFATAMPSTGSWTAGDYVQNSTPAVAGTAGSQYVIKGWIRLTTGSTNNSGTDWVQDRALTGT